MPRDWQIRDAHKKSASSSGGFYPKCLKRVHKSAQINRRGEEKGRAGRVGGGRRGVWVKKKKEKKKKVEDPPSAPPKIKRK